MPQVEPDQRRSTRATARRGGSVSRLFDAVLLDRDGTLIEDVPYNGNPERVRPMPGARAALDALRSAGLRLAVVTNQSGLAKGLFTEAQLRAVHARVEQVLGPFDAWLVCPHDDDDRCSCRKPAPELIHAAARRLGTTPQRCVLVGDIGRDVTAALAAGAQAVLVPTPLTRPPETSAAPWVAADLPAAAAEILRRQAAIDPATHRRALPSVGLPSPATVASAGAPSPATVASAVRRSRPSRRAGTVLVVRSDSAGDVLVTGPGIRAVAAHARRVVLLCGPRGRAAADLLPGVDTVIEHQLPWIDPAPAPVTPHDIATLTTALAAVDADEAVIFTSYHQSPLPLALLLRAVGVERICAISDDYPGSLLDVRHHVPTGTPEPERALSLAAAAGYPLPFDDEPVLRLRPVPPPPARVGAPGYVVLHPGSAAQSRGLPPDLAAEIVRTLVGAGHRVVVTGGPDEVALTARVAGGIAVDLGGGTGLADLAATVAGAAAVVVGNTGPAHLAAAYGVPVVSLFAPTVPFGQWGPWRVPTVRLGDPDAPCRGTRAATCPVPGHPCLSRIRPEEVLAALTLLGVPLSRPPTTAVATALARSGR
ncbi:HAD-IIIA family hydrolase [Salinispora arenicola]|uniref:HAD-IIIA family hydrolase n=1 Tax=Salinispora arenicola TaxID=168697 RepID=UPI00037485FA|nr:HAD-IIIA family hydrolase [Salinispora arenicola]MCN0153957.1 HAD-IIIA family hydrolase [Salinispora arenicola]